MLQLESSSHVRSVDHVLAYFEPQITVGSQKHSQIMRQKTCCASESNTSVRVVFANGNGFDVPIGVVLPWEERGSWINMSGRQIAIGSQKPSRITRQKTCCASESNTSVRVVFANRCGFDAPIAVVVVWDECGSCLNIFRKKNHGRISETFTNYEAKDLLRKSVDHAFTYSGRQIVAGSQKPSRITRQKTCCASESKTSVRVVFLNRSGIVAPIGVVLAWEERGSCINIFRMTNSSQISETFTNYEAKDLLRKQKTCCATESNTSVRVIFANRSRFDAPIGLVLAWEERGSCLNIFRTINGGRISETFTNYDAQDLLRNGFDAPIAVFMAWDERGSCLKIFRTTNRVVIAWEERGSSLNIFQTTNHGQISETFTNYEAKDWLRKSVDHVLTYSRRKITVGSQKPSRITWQKTCCTSESNKSVRVVLANRSGFDAPIGVVLAWEERGSCLNIFRMTNRGRISETFTNYEAKDLLRQ
ncbi:uncharacterized protein G2W53_041669 [Senna tora]|uniref:Uncharacterized protein n=1 Tax=Senna tora TaxID=362788 RepID=A0A834SHT7_9FABA|nr:uncharacterized protein G2W53_041669 [Senna tora]